jgi:hypothetical protein
MGTIQLPSREWMKIYELVFLYNKKMLLIILAPSFAFAITQIQNALWDQVRAAYHIVDLIQIMINSVDLLHPVTKIRNTLVELIWFALNKVSITVNVCQTQH